MKKIVRIFQQLKMFFTKQRIDRIEPYVFFILVLINASILLTPDYFCSLDGPSHIYNAGLVGELLWGDDTAVPQVYSISREPIPNWPSHILLLVFRSFVSPWMAEKLLLMLCCFILPYALRALLKTVGNFSLARSLLAFPFTYTAFITLGFYNFIIATILLILFIRSVHLVFFNRNWKTLIRCFIWLTLLYFSHPYIFAVGCSIAGIMTLIRAIILTTEHQFRQGIKLLGSMLLLVLPHLILFLLFLNEHMVTTGNPLYFSQETLWKEFLRGYTFTMYHLEPDYFYARWFIRIWIGLVSLAVLFRLIYWKRYKSFAITDAWLITAIIIIIAYFKLPDDLGGAMNSKRLCYLFIFCFVIWLLFQPIKRQIWIIVIPALLYFHIHLLKLRYNDMSNKEYAERVEELIKAGEQLAPNSITFPFSFYSGDWQWWWPHAINHLGVASNRAVVDNYEANSEWFPIKWAPETMFRLRGQDRHIQKVDDRIPKYFWVPAKKILYADYVLIWEEPKNAKDSASFDPIDSLIQQNYKLFYTSKHVRLYK